MHEECKQKGYLTRTKQRAVLGDQRIFFPGNVTDRVVRDWLKSDNPQPGEMPDMVSGIMERERQLILLGDPDKDRPPGKMSWKDSQDRNRVEKECIEAVTKIEPDLLKYVLPFDYDADFSFTAPVTVPHPDGGMETVYLVGYMDIIVRDKRGQWWVFDVKHTKDSGYWRKTVAQLTFYDLAVLLMFGQPTKGTALFQPLATPTKHPHQVTEQARNELMQRFMNLAWDRFMDDRTPREDRKPCGFCDVKHACTVFQPVRDSKGKMRVSL